MLYFLCVTPISNIFAINFGSRGAVFEIKEEGFIAMIKRKLSKIDISAEREKMERFTKGKLDRLTSAPNIKYAKEDRVFLLNPSYISEEDVLLPCGSILVAKGDVVNPLDHIDFDMRLFFIDARIEEHILWLEERLLVDESDDKNRVILVGGNPLELKSRIRHEVYFDQHGELINKFKIAAFPAIVEREADALKISEVYLKGE